LCAADDQAGDDVEYTDGLVFRSQRIFSTITSS
jgi:hypothetical protein